MMRISLFINILVITSILSACGSGEQEEQIVDTTTELKEIPTQSSQDVSEHSSFEQLSGMFEKLVNQNVESSLGLVPLAEQTILDLSAFFPAQLLSYIQTIETPISKEENNIHAFTTAYEKEEEAVLFTIYQFESSLKILEFFMVIDSIYKKDPDLIINEISIDGLDGWEVIDRQGKKLEVCLVLPDTRLIQGSAGKVFYGDMIAMLTKLQLTKL